MELLKTPLHAHHLKLGAKMVPFAGYSMPVQYTGLLEEARATRRAGGLFDVSHMGQFWVRGAAAIEKLQRVTTNDVSRLQVGQAQYNIILNERGGIIDDIVVYRREETAYFLCVNAANRCLDWQWFSHHLGADSLSDASDFTALIAIQGPNAEAIVERLVPCGIASQLKYYWACETMAAGIPVYLSRTGYTGEDGFELFMASDTAGKLWDAILELGGRETIVPVGLGARDTLRTEMGYPLHGHELSDLITPFEARLGWVVKMNKDFIGKPALRAQLDTGPSRLLRGLIVEDRRIARPGYGVFHQDKQIGQITSGTFSPHLEQPIALALIDASVPEDSSITVQIRHDWIPARIVPIPFLKPKTKRSLSSSQAPQSPKQVS